METSQQEIRKNVTSAVNMPKVHVTHDNIDD